MSGAEEDLKACYATEMKDRAVRPLGDERTARVTAFAKRLHTLATSTVVEVGCGAGRDGLIFSESGCSYTGVDLSPAAVQTCRDRGLYAVEASATDLPFADDYFDAAWSMSTLMHLPGDGFDVAVAELRRVVKPGGLVAIGVWGHTTDREWTKPDGRFFKHRSDEELHTRLHDLGDVVAFETWDWFEDGGHYQFAQIQAR